jgi:hypothetical protein
MHTNNIDGIGHNSNSEDNSEEQVKLNIFN